MMMRDDEEWAFDVHVGSASDSLLGGDESSSE